MVTGDISAYAEFFENAPLPMFLTRPDGRILDANVAACRLFGYTRDELMALGRQAVVDPSDPRLAVALEHRRHTGRFRGPLTMKRKDGSRLEVELASDVYTEEGGLQRTSMVVLSLAAVEGDPRVVPVCSYCHRARVAPDDWQSLESYVATRLGHRISHGICPGCYEKYIIPQL